MVINICTKSLINFASDLFFNIEVNYLGMSHEIFIKGSNWYYPISHYQGETIIVTLSFLI